MKKRKWFQKILVILLVISMTVPVNTAVYAAELTNGADSVQDGNLNSNSDMSGDELDETEEVTDTTEKTDTDKTDTADNIVDSSVNDPAQSVDPDESIPDTEGTDSDNDVENKNEDLDTSDSDMNIEETGEVIVPVSLYRASSENPVAQIGDKTYLTLENAIDEAEEGDTIQLLADIELTKAVYIKKSVTISGSKDGQTGKNGEGCYKVSAPIGSGGRVFNLDASEEETAIADNSSVTFENIQIEGPMTADGNTRGISIYQTSGLIVNLENAYVSASCYALNVASNNTGIKVNMNNSKLEGWCAFQLWSPAEINVKNSELIGTNKYTSDKKYSFATIVVNQNSVASTITIENSTVKAISDENKDTPQEILSIQNINNDGAQNYPSGNQITFTNCNIVAEGNWKPDGQSEIKLEPIYYAEGSNTLVIDDITYFIPEYGKEIEDILDAVATITRDGKKIAYGSLEAAIGDAADGETVTLLKDTEISDRIDITAGITLNLNGKIITDKHSGAGIVCNADSIIIKNGTINADNEMAAIYLLSGNVTAEGLSIDTCESNGGAGNWGDTSGVYIAGGTFTLKEDCSIKSNEVGIFIVNEGSTANIYGTIETISSVKDTDGTSGGYAAIQGNGSSGKGGTIINVYDGALVKAASGTGMYLPQSGTVNVYGGTIEGATGIGIKSGTLNITGGTIIGNGAYYNSVESVTNGIQFDGSAVMVDSYIGYAGEMNINVSGKAVLKSENAYAIHEIGNTSGATNIVNLDIKGGTFTGANDKEAVLVRTETESTVNISGGAFSSQVPENYCAEGYDPTGAILVNGYYTVKIEDSSEENCVAQIGSLKFKTLTAAIQAVQDGIQGNIELLDNVTESITIPAGVDVTLDLNGKTLTNEEGKDTISNYGTLTITDSSENKAGIVDNVTHTYGALVNYPSGTVILNGGTLTRSAENDGTDGNKNSWYTIKNMGNMTIKKDVTVTTGKNGTGGGSSSLIANGWYDGSSDPNNNSNDRKTTHEGTVTANLIIEGGTFIGGMNTVKNDDWSVLKISGGTFSNTTGPAILNWNEASISGGTFKAVTGHVLANGYGNDISDKGQFTITGGTFISGNNGKDNLFGYGDWAEGGTLAITGGNFIGLNAGAAQYKVAISGGSFSNKVPDEYCADGFVPTDVLVNNRYEVMKESPAAPSNNNSSGSGKKKHHKSSKDSDSDEAAAVSTAQSVTSAHTGDSTNVWLPVLLLLISLAGAGSYGYLTVFKKKRR